jgi:hypothetical protein
MATRIESPHSATLPAQGPEDRIGARIVPVTKPSATMTTTGTTDAMDVSPAQSPSASNTSPAAHSDSENVKSGSQPNQSPPQEHGSFNSSNMPAPPPSAAGAAAQPKIVQTAFIHKLYK